MRPRIEAAGRIRSTQNNGARDREKVKKRGSESAQRRRNKSNSGQMRYLKDYECASRKSGVQGISAKLEAP